MPRCGISRTPQQCKHLIDGLKACVPLLEEAGITLLVEPLNVRFDHAGYFLSGSEEGFAMIKEAGSSNVKLLFDIYHQQIAEGNLIPNIARNLELIGHFHAAGHPGRHEPHTGEIYYPEVFRAIDKAGYEGYVGLEYFPRGDPVEGLKTFLAWNWGRPAHGRSMSCRYSRNDKEGKDYAQSIVGRSPAQSRYRPIRGQSDPI